MRYHFDFSGFGITTRDIEGQEIGTPEQIPCEAGRILTEIAQHHLQDRGELPVKLQVEARAGQTIVTKLTLRLEMEESV